MYRVLLTPISFHKIQQQKRDDICKGPGVTNDIRNFVRPLRRPSNQYNCPIRKRSLSVQCFHSASLHESFFEGGYYLRAGSEAVANDETDFKAAKRGTRCTQLLRRNCRQSYFLSIDRNCQFPNPSARHPRCFL